ncbi:MAG: hypothetical protein WC359_12520 [Dehalococcoidia bacterium]|jgi:hypothetical protein
MGEKIEVRLQEGITLEGKFVMPSVPALRDKGIFLEDVHRTDLTYSTSGAIPLAKLVFIPYDSILYIVLKQ